MKKRLAGASRPELLTDLAGAAVVGLPLVRTMLHSICIALVSAILVALPSAAAAKELIVDARLHHLRLGQTPEWSDFPAKPEGESLRITFTATANESPQTLRWRQQDVKQTWKVLLNNKERSQLVINENDMVVYLSLPAGALRDGDNELRIEQVGKVPDDIRVGEIRLDDRSREAVLSEGRVEVSVGDAEHRGTRLPCRITVLNSERALMSVGAKSDDHHAVRPGIIYTSTGRAEFGLPAGKYTIYAGRGFAYGIDSATITVEPGQTVRKRLAIRREVMTPGFVSCDTHVHTFTHSGHGDCTINERMITLAGENIELPIATDHNVHIDYLPTAERLGVRKFFTPVIGNEVTTSVGHFCIFPVPGDSKSVPDWKLKDWKAIFGNIESRTSAKAIVLNHGRDIHLGYRPFDPKHHNAVSGENLDGWQLRANAMEVINSGALLTDNMRLFQDWFGLLNRGIYLTPVASSDSHDVGRSIVGQGRTYIRAKSDDPGSIDVEEALKSFRAGRVMVSLGLLAEIAVNGKYGPGDLAPSTDPLRVRVRVLGPAWTMAEKIELFANGRRIQEAVIKHGKRPGVKFDQEWELPRFRHDVHLVAIATGPGMKELYWPIARPYQPASPIVRTQVIGASGAVWIDGDGDGKRSSAYDYARKIVETHGDDTARAVAALADYDEAVAVQVAGILQGRGTSVADDGVRKAAKKAGSHVERGFEAYFEAWRQSQIARSQPARSR
jgi:hypothetical protein